MSALALFWWFAFIACGLLLGTSLWALVATLASRRD